MYNETHGDETYDDYVTWEDDRLQHPNHQPSSPPLAPAAARPTPRCRFQPRRQQNDHHQEGADHHYEQDDHYQQGLNLAFSNI